MSCSPPRRRARPPRVTGREEEGGGGGEALPEKAAAPPWFISPLPEAAAVCMHPRNTGSSIWPRGPRLRRRGGGWPYSDT